LPSAISGREELLQRLRGGGGGFDDVGVELGHLGLDAVAGVLGRGARVDGAAHGGEELLERAERRAFGDALQPAVGGRRPAACTAMSSASAPASS
jgi:hypothetical protein